VLTCTKVPKVGKDLSQLAQLARLFFPTYSEEIIATIVENGRHGEKL